MFDALNPKQPWHSRLRSLKDFLICGFMQDERGLMPLQETCMSAKNSPFFASNVRASEVCQC